jgi:tRNA threonylcarbamoyl adenosine modification protein TsaD
VVGVSEVSAQPGFIVSRYEMPMNICLGIETSCDETAAAVVRDGREILSNVIASQLDLHAEYGGVVPELACRRHGQLIDKIVERALKEAGVTLDEIDLVSVVQGPGLIGALLIGVNFAKALAWARGLPLVPVNHVEAHVYSCFMSNPGMALPAVGLVASGGHTSLFIMENVGRYRKLGETTDDAVGESFDKVASLLGLPYMGGPHVEKLALKGDPNAIRFPRGMSKKKGYDFSYSGLKTAVLYRVKATATRSETRIPFPRRREPTSRRASRRRLSRSSYKRPSGQRKPSRQEASPSGAASRQTSGCGRYLPKLRQNSAFLSTSRTSGYAPTTPRWWRVWGTGCTFETPAPPPTTSTPEPAWPSCSSPSQFKPRQHIEE